MTQVIGCFACTFKNSPATISVAINDLLPVLLKAHERKDDELNRNVAYCLGLMVEYGPTLMAPHLNFVLLAL
jgi:hypothetical protein